jgi:hypothetical protein
LKANERDVKRQLKKVRVLVDLSSTAQTQARNVSAVSDAPSLEAQRLSILIAGRVPYSRLKEAAGVCVGRGSMGIECGQKREATEVRALSGRESGGEPHQF